MANILMAGAAGRNLGKTEFLCRAIREQSQTRPVVGVKVTTIDDTLADYRNIPDDYLVSVEIPTDDNKDTHRMFRSGAASVFWLRVKRPALSRGMDALLKRMEQDGVDLASDCIVMESGAARNMIEPGLFFIIRQHNDELKPSCAEVVGFSDRLVRVSGDGWDLLPEHLTYENGRWGLKEEACAIVLSGGASQRMGSDKSLMELNGRPMIEQVLDQLSPNFEQVTVSGPTEKYAFLDYETVEDVELDKGPLMGLFSALQKSKHDLNFVTGCDVPDISLSFVRRMLREADGYDAVVAMTQDENKQPLFAVYRKSVLSMIRNVLADERRSMHALLDRINVHYLEIPGEWFYNLNTPADVETWRKRQ